MQAQLREYLKGELSEAHEKLIALLDHSDISSNEQFKGLAEGIKSSAAKLADNKGSNSEIIDNADILQKTKDLVETAINTKDLSSLEVVNSSLQIHAEEMRNVSAAAGIQPTVAPVPPQPLTQETSAAQPKTPNKPLPATPLAQTDSTQKSAAKADSTQAPAKGIKPQSAGRSFSDSLSKSMEARLIQGRKDLESLPIMGPLYKALFAAIETAIENRKAEKVKEAKAARESATVEGEAEAPKAQAAETKAASVTTSPTKSTPETTPATTQTVTNQHGKVNVKSVAGKPDALSSSSPKALMAEVKNRNYKSFTITSGSPQKALECMREGAAAGVPYVAVSKEMEDKIMANPKLAEQYKELKAEQDKRLAELKQNKSNNTLTGEASQPVPNKPLPKEPAPDKPLPETPQEEETQTQNDSQLKASDTTKHAPTPMPEEPKPKPLPETPQQKDAQQASAQSEFETIEEPSAPSIDAIKSAKTATSMPRPEPELEAKPEPPPWTENSNAAVLQAPDDQKGQVLSDEMSKKEMDSHQLHNLKESLGDEKYTQVVASATSAPQPTPAQTPLNDQEQIEQKESMNAAQDLKDTNLSTARANLNNQQLDSYTQQVEQQGLTKVDNDLPADTEIDALKETQEELMREEKDGNSNRPADPDTRSSSSSNASNTRQNISTNNTANTNDDNNQSSNNDPTNQNSNNGPGNTANSNAPNSSTGNSNTGSSFDSTTVGNRADNVLQAQQDKQNQLDQSGPSTPSPGGTTPGG